MAAGSARSCFGARLPRASRPLGPVVAPPPPPPPPPPQARSFLVPYIIMLVVEGMPLLYLELAVGQRMRQGSIGAWRTISPYLGGVGLPVGGRNFGQPLATVSSAQPSRLQPGRVILLLTNSFDLEDGFLTASNLEQVKGYLASAFPGKYSEVLPQIRNCSLESELATAVQGTGLSFIVYTEAIKNMAASQLWSVLYFFMLLMLGIGSMLGNTAAILTPLTDSKVISSHLPKEAISGLVCLVNCVIGLVFTMEAGNYWFDIFNDYAATLPLLLIVLVEIVAVCYVFGLRRFESDLKAMTGRTLNWYWKAMWAGLSPLLIISLFVFYLSDYILTGTLQYQAWDASQGQLVTKDYPLYALAIIGLLVASSTMCIPLVALGTFIVRCLKRGDTPPVA
ncbi:sodium- and chloride-dependent transporter XTRP3 [Puma concolor]|uniref:Sodium- and chloride-dependent transporter XTRP3 n=1 Tax=Puma concolor TaxID=9696 RepID=A0A6P6H7R3_PUMCO|nr:sodium- and chloride-dependent transporter XTRP3 [Puma concolor]